MMIKDQEVHLVGEQLPWPKPTAGGLHWCGEASGNSNGIDLGRK